MVGVPHGLVWNSDFALLAFSKLFTFTEFQHPPLKNRALTP